MASDAVNGDEDAAADLPFEEALAELETIVQRLEDGELSLEEALACYEAGIGHLRRCHGLLRDAERKISLLVELREDGTAVLEKFEEQPMSLEEKQEARDRRRSRRRSSTGAEPDGADGETQQGLF